MPDTTQLDALIYWFEQYDTINLAQAKAGLPTREDYNHKVKIERVAPLIFTLRNSGWVITTEKDEAGVAHYRVVSKPEVLAPGQLRRVDPKRQPAPIEEKADPHWECSRPGCISGVIPDQVSGFDGRYTTGRCFTHGKVVLMRR
jgi:hypothetical protein